MPTMAQLGELASQMYVGNPSIGAKESKSHIQYDPNSPVSKALGLTPGFFLWSEATSSRCAYNRYFNTTYSGWDSYDGTRNHSYLQAVCVGE